MNGETSGLRFDPSGEGALDTLRQQAQSLSHGLRIDTDRARTFVTASTEATQLVGGLVTDDDPEALDEQLRALRAGQADLRLRRLLERAEGAADRGDHLDALRLVDEALGLDRTSAAAWLLKGRCLIAIGEFTQAEQAIAVARRQARDAHEARLATALRAACDREEMREFTARLIDVVDRGRLVEADRLVVDRLRDRPDHPVLLQNRCALLLLSGDVATARSVAEHALRVVDRSSADRFDELLRHIAERECEPRLRDARRALRGGDTRTAVARLDDCVAAIGHTEYFGVLRSYALERHTERSSSAVVRRLRKRRVDVEPIDGETLQRLLEWLVDEELTAGCAAFAAEDYRTAGERFTAAAAIDDRCALVAVLHAASLFRELVAGLNSARQPDLEHARRVLVRADGLAARCADDATVGAESRQLRETVRSTLTAVEAAQVRVARMRAVDDCVSRFNLLAQHYGKFTIRTPEQLENARRSFTALALEVSRLQRDRSAGTEDAGVLKEMADRLAQIRRQLSGY